MQLKVYIQSDLLIRKEFANQTTGKILIGELPSRAIGKTINCLFPVQTSTNCDQGPRWKILSVAMA